MNNIKFCIANWKMYLNQSESIDFINTFNENKFDDLVKAVICPSYTSISELNKIKSKEIYLGTQNVSLFDKGPYTGQISIEMVIELNCDYVIVGHSERREYNNETDKDINHKLIQLLKTNLTPIICIGEKLLERDKNIHFEVIEKQLNVIFNNLEIPKSKDILIAYEPIWAIGSGRSANVEIIESMHNHIKNIIKNIMPNNRNIYILYGGSVNLSNSIEIGELENVDGFLIGTSSLKPDIFYGIYKNLKGEN